MTNRIEIGSYTFEGGKIESGRATYEHSMIGETLSYDTCSFTVVSVGTSEFVDADELNIETEDNQVFYARGNENIDSLPQHTAVYFYQDDVLKGKFYTNKITQIAPRVFTIDCYSIIGVLSNSTHLGGMYSGVLASEVFADILDNVPYTLDQTLANTTVRGYLPVDTRRNNLQQLLFATDSCVKIDYAGAMTIIPMMNNSTGQIDKSRTYDNGQVEVSDRVDGVQLTEHNYFKSNIQETLFDDSVFDKQLVTFDNAHHAYEVTVGGITYTESDAGFSTYVESYGANFIVAKSATPQTAVSMVIKAKTYTHVTRVISVGNTTATGSQNIKTVSKAYLLNPEIADTMAERVYRYLQCDTRIKQKVVVGDERPADVVTVWNPFKEEYVSACIEKMDITLSGINAAQCDFLVGFVPEGPVTGFQHYMLLDGEGSWSKANGHLIFSPDSGKVIVDDEEVTGDQDLGNVEKIRFILVGGGGGGGKGLAGQAGGKSQVSFTVRQTYGTWGGTYADLNALNPGTGGVGGQGGEAGDNSPIFEISIPIENGDNGSFTCGAAGLASTTASKTAGNPTHFTFGNLLYTSDNGRKYNDGYHEAKSGLVFGNAGVAGLNGGKGGDGANSTASNAKGGNGEDVGSYKGGIGGSRAVSSGESGERTWWSYTYFGCGGGGASGLANGSNGSGGGAGKGANGGNAVAPTNYGAGGNGGFGGGGGGGGSPYNWYYSNFGHDQETYYDINGAAGGTGGNGSDGMKGCIVIYY